MKIKASVGQQAFLHKEKHRLGVAWPLMADLMGVSYRRLLSWKLPAASPGHRSMPADLCMLLMSLRPYSFDQLAYLEGAKARLGCAGWDQFAEMTGLNRRALKNWIKDPDSSEFRHMKTADAQLVQSALDRMHSA